MQVTGMKRDSLRAERSVKFKQINEWNFNKQYNRLRLGNMQTCLKNNSNLPNSDDNRGEKVMAIHFVQGGSPNNLKRWFT